AYLALGGDEIGAARRGEDVLIGGERPLAVIAVEQALRSLARQDELQFPRKIVDILDAAVRAARAERRYQVRRIADEQRATPAERMHAAALEGLDARPLDLEARVLAEHSAQPRQDPFRLFLLFRIRIPTQLEVDAPYIVGLAMQQGRLIGVERRIEPEPALGGKIR